MRGWKTAGGDSMASFLMGQFPKRRTSFYEIQFQPATENYQYATFAQDNWKVTRKLTLNLGLRYDVSLPRTDRFNRQNWFDPNVVSPLNNGSISYTDPISGSDVTRPLLGGEVFASSKVRTNYVTDWSDIQPRFGFAYQFAPKMVVRGGYGIYYGQSRSGASGVVPYGGEGFDQYTNMITTYNNDGATPYLHLSNPFPNGLIQPPGSALGLLNDVGHNANGPLRTRAADQTPYEQSWSFGIERQMPWNVVVDAEYHGKERNASPLQWREPTQHPGSVGGALRWEYASDERPQYSVHEPAQLRTHLQPLLRDHHRSQQHYVEFGAGLSAGITRSAIHRGEHRRADDRELDLSRIAAQREKSLQPWPGVYRQLHLVEIH